MGARQRSCPALPQAVARQCGAASRILRNFSSATDSALQFNSTYNRSCGDDVINFRGVAYSGEGEAEGQGKGETERQQGRVGQLAQLAYADWPGRSGGWAGRSLQFSNVARPAQTG